MSYRFVFGPSGSGKSYTLRNEVIQRSMSALDHFVCAGQDCQETMTNYLYIVPDQYTMQTQQDLVAASQDGGILNVDVLSFGRLSHRIWEELGEPTATPLDDIGKSLVIRRVAEQIREQLPVLGSRMGRLGMVSEVKSMISEFMQYDLGVADVRGLAAYAEGRGQRALAARLTDLAALYEGFLQYEADRFRTREETNDLLAERIPESTWIANSEIVFDGFTGFTPVQYRVVEALLTTARMVTFVLPLGADGGPDAAGTVDPEVPIDQQDLFYLTRHTVRSILRVAKRAGVAHAADVDLTGEEECYRFRNAPALARFEQELFRYGAATPTSSAGRVQIYQASTPEEEVRELCIRIHRLVREEGIAYRDCGIVCGDLATYEDALNRMAMVYDLPIHVDRTHPILRNPLTESIRAALEVVGGDYSYDTMFRYLRAGLTSLSIEEVDRLENYCLANGIKTRRHWNLSIDNDEEMDRLRMRVLAELEPLTVPRGASAGIRTEALYQYLVGVHARERMLTYAERFAGQEDHLRRQEYEQIYRVVIRLMDQIHDLIGEDPISSEDYLEILEAGFAELRLGVVPQRVDRILAGDMERSRMPECKVLFFLGANDGNVPKGTSKGGLISDLDREFLAGSDAELAPTPREQMYLQRLYLYLNLTKATERLVISYTQTSADGKSIRPSYLVETIRRMYTDVEIAYPEAMATATSQADRLVGSVDTIQYLAVGIRQYADGMFERDPVAADVFRTVYGYAAQHITEERPGDVYGAASRAGSRVLELTAAAFRNYTPHPIDRTTAAALYGQILYGSVSRLETAAQCYLRHYLQYGLRLQEREERRFESRDAGSILHEAVQRFAQLLRERGLTWQGYTREEGMALADEALDAVATGYEHGLAAMDARTSGATQRMRRVLHRTVMALQYQVQQGQFVPSLFEQDFGDSSAMRYDLGDGRGVHLHGRIDRVDLCEQNGKVYIKIIDYKSGRKDLDDERIRAGLQLQLPLYLGAEMDVQQGLHPDAEIVPAGMLYYHFDDPILSGNDAAKVLQGAMTAEEAILRRLMPTGRVNSDPEVLALLDSSGEARSRVIPVSFKTNGELYKSSSVYTQAQLQELLEGIRETICTLSTKILDGETRANPVVLNTRQTACTYCAYKSVCGFDRKLPGYKLREMKDPRE